MERRKVLAKECGQVAAVEIVGGLKPQLQHVASAVRSAQLALAGQIGDAAKAEATLRTEEAQLQGLRALGAKRSPGLFLGRHEEMHDLLVVPEELAVGSSLLQQLAELLQHVDGPIDALARREAFARKVPLLAEHFPGH